MLDRRLLLVSGKGGVGKSAVAGALSILAARRGLRVLAIALAEGGGLASHLGIRSVGYEPVRISPGLFAASVDRARGLDEYLKLQTHLPRAVPTRQLTRALNILVDTAPGIREIITIGKPIYEVWRDTWDLVVADAPALGQLQSYLSAPETITGLVPTGAVRDQSARMAETLADIATSALVLVTTPEELPVVEVEEAKAELEAQPVIPVGGVVVNRVLPDLEIDGAGLAAHPSHPATEAARLHLDLLEAQAPWRQRIGSEVELPFLFGMHTPAEVAARLADELERLV